MLYDLFWPMLILALGCWVTTACYAEAVFPTADWEKATLESQGVSALELRAAIERLEERLRDHGGARTLVIIRNGYLIFKGPDCDVPYQIYSATKSFTSTCLGLLIDDGKASLDTLAKDYVPGLSMHYPAVTLRHFATMTSGYDAQGEGYEMDAEGRWDGGDTPLVPASPLFAPGAKFRYWDKAMLQFGNVLTRIAGEPLDQLFKRRIADPIGMKGWEWRPYPTAEGHILHWTGGICASARELARFGHLFLNRGNWGGKQLISASWVDQATSVQVPASVPNDDLPRSRGAGIYGYNWWINGVKPDGTRLWPDAPSSAYRANGLNANVCIVIPEWNMVVARTNGFLPDGSPSGPADIDDVWNTFLGEIGESLQVASGRREPAPRHTEVSIHGDAFYLNGRPTYAGRRWQGHRIEGLLFNSRMVQGIFDDLNLETRERWAYPDTGEWDPERNTNEFLAAMPDWRAHGLLAFTINLQGGNPRGYRPDQPWHNSALTETGELRLDYMARLQRILDRADELGMVAILGIFYFGQDERLRDETAVLRGLDNAVDWILERDYRHVLIEVNNECNVNYEHPMLQPERVHELIERVKATSHGGRRLLVGTSYGGGTLPEDSVVAVSDFVLLHGDNLIEDPAHIAEMVRYTRGLPSYRPMPILFNEDDHFRFDEPQNCFLSAIGEYASWGYFDPGESNYRDGYQSPPVNWSINTERKRQFFDKLREVTGE